MGSYVLNGWHAHNLLGKFKHKPLQQPGAAEAESCWRVWAGLLGKKFSMHPLGGIEFLGNCCKNKFYYFLQICEVDFSLRV